MKTVRANTGNQYVDYKFRLKNSVCNEKLKEAIKPYIDWNVDETSNAQTLHYDFTNFVTNSFDSAYPMIEVRRKKLDVRKHYINRELKSLIREKHRLKKLFRRFPYTYAQVTEQLEKKSL